MSKKSQIKAALDSGNTAKANKIAVAAGTKITIPGVVLGKGDKDITVDTDTLKKLQLNKIAKYVQNCLRIAQYFKLNSIKLKGPGMAIPGKILGARGTVYLIPDMGKWMYGPKGKPSKKFPASSRKAVNDYIVTVRKANYEASQSYNERKKAAKKASK